MPLDLADCTFYGHALPEPFVKLDLEPHLAKAGLLPKAVGPEGKALQEGWEAYRRSLRALGSTGGALRVLNHVLSPLAEPLGYGAPHREEVVTTREGDEDGGWIMNGAGRLRLWAYDGGADLDAPSRRGRAYRFSPGRVAQRVLSATGERVGLLTNGVELRLLVCDPARPESHIGFRLDRGEGGWAGRNRVPDSFRLFLALASPKGVAALPGLTEAARLNQTKVTATLRVQARRAVEGFLQEVLEHPANQAALATYGDRQVLAKELWREGLVLVYRLLFVLKLESSPDPARAFSFASSSLWRSTYSPNVALGRVARRVVKESALTGRLLEDGLRALFRLFVDGMTSSEMRVSALGGMLFGADTTRLLDSLAWGERAVAQLLFQLLWAETREGERRVHYGTLDVEDLGRIYEGLLELEPGISAQPMCRLRRQKLEVVVPLAQGEPYRECVSGAGRSAGEKSEESEGEEKHQAPANGEKKKLLWVEVIPEGRFFLRVGLGRKATGSFYTPRPFVRFLVQETLGPQAAERSPENDPQPSALLMLKVLDPAMGSGHFLVESCRFLGEKLYEACRLCDEQAATAEEAVAKARTDPERERLLARAKEMRRRVEELPDPNDRMVAYLPSHVLEGDATGLSQAKALALARRLVAVHCLYGVDLNPLAVGLAKLSLWLESYAEGLPLTFLDHRLVYGDSLTGPFFENLLTYPGSGGPISELLAKGLADRLRATLADALAHVRDLEATVGKDISDLTAKRAAKERLEAALAPYRLVAAAWSGGVKLGLPEADDVAYQDLLAAVASRRDATAILAGSQGLRTMVDTGRDGVPYDLVFPEVFSLGSCRDRAGFDAVVGNPPWNKVKFEFRELSQLLVPGWFVGKERGRVAIPGERSSFAVSDPSLAEQELGSVYLKRTWARLGRLRAMDTASIRADTDAYQIFLERSMRFVAPHGSVGQVLSSGLFKNPADGYLRRALVARGTPHWVLHFVNLERLFPDLAPVMEFCLLVWMRDRTGESFVAADLASIPQYMIERNRPHEHNFSTPELELSVASTGLFPRGHETPTTGPVLSVLSEIESSGVRLGNDLHRTGGEAALLTLRSILPEATDARDARVAARLWTRGLVPCYSSRSIAQHDALHSRRLGKWNPSVDYVADLRHPLANHLTQVVRYYRLAVRSTCGSPNTNQRSVVACLLPPGAVASHSMLVDIHPQAHATVHALLLVARLNSFSVDHSARPLITSNLGKEILRSAVAPAAIPRGCQAARFLAHAALRLECNGESYEALWREQLADAWREATAPLTWPVLGSDDSRWAVRAAIDVAVADAYGFSREQYARVLATFRHKSYPKAPELCLTAFDELKAIGLDAFAKMHDPYWDIPLNENLPTPVIDGLMPSGAMSQQNLDLLGEGSFPGPEQGRRRTE